MAQELILTFHGVGDPPHALADGERRVWVALEWFEAILDALPRQGVKLAFDDGNASDVRHALPALADRGMTARFFPLTGRIATAGYLSAEDILTLSAAGMQIGSHGIHHRDWRTLDDSELRDELVASRRALAEIVRRDVVEAACPFGSYDRRVLRALRDAGYSRAFTSDGGTASVGSWLSARTTVNSDLPLPHWLDLVAAAPGARPSLARSGRRLLKRLR